MSRDGVCVYARVAYACERTCVLVAAVHAGAWAVCSLCTSTSHPTILVSIFSWRRLHRGIRVVRHLDVVTLRATAPNA